MEYDPKTSRLTLSGSLAASDVAASWRLVGGEAKISEVEASGLKNCDGAGLVALVGTSGAAAASTAQTYPRARAALRCPPVPYLARPNPCTIT